MDDIFLKTHGGTVRIDGRRRSVTDRTGRGVEALLAGRLHYRGPADEGDDAQAAIDLYCGKGLEGLAALEGDFALVIVDPREDRIIALRDPMGSHSLFWRRDREGLTLGSDLRALAAGQEAPNPAYLADRLLAGTPNPDRLTDTPFRDVQRLRPGHLLTCKRDGSALGIRRLWDWGARIGGVRALPRDATAGELRDRLTSAVHERAQGIVATHLSGGMDSTSVALIAAQIRPPVHGLTLFHQAIAPLRDERRFVELVRHPGLVKHPIAADALLDFSGLWALGPHAEPNPWLFRIRQDLALLGKAREVGATTVLSGEGADETLALPPVEIADALRRGRIGSAYSEATRWALACGTSTTRFLGSLNLPSGLFPGLFRVAAPSWLDPDFVRSVDWSGRAGALARRRFHGEKSCALSQIVSQIDASAGDWAAQTLARPLGLSLAHPFRDPRVLTFGAAARLAEGADPIHPKPLLARAMRGILPEPVLERRSKASFSPVFYLGFARYREALLKLVAEAPPEIDQVFRREALGAAIADAALGYRPLVELHGLGTALSILRWMILLPRWQKGEAALSERLSG